jgi:hypothetical protein
VGAGEGGGGGENRCFFLMTYIFRPECQVNVHVLGYRDVMRPAPWPGPLLRYSSDFK